MAKYEVLKGESHVTFHSAPASKKVLRVQAGPEVTIYSITVFSGITADDSLCLEYSVLKHSELKEGAIANKNNSKF